MTIFGLRLTWKRSALVGSVLLVALLLLAGLTLIHLPPGEALLGAVIGALLYWSGETVHQFGHAWAASAVGYPMSGIRYWGLLSTSVYPPDEPPLRGALHIRRALGGPFFSFIYSVVAAVLAAVAQPNSIFGWLMVFLTLVNVFIFTLGALLPLGFTDGSTILTWWGRHDEEG